MTPSIERPTSDEMMAAMMVSAVADRATDGRMEGHALAALKMAVMVRMGINKAGAMLTAIQECDAMSDELVAGCYCAATDLMNEPKYQKMFAEIEERARFGIAILGGNVAAEGGTA